MAFLPVAPLGAPPKAAALLAARSPPGRSGGAAPTGVARRSLRPRMTVDKGTSEKQSILSSIDGLLGGLLNLGGGNKVDTAAAPAADAVDNADVPVRWVARVWACPRAALMPVGSEGGWGAGNGGRIANRRWGGRQRPSSWRGQLGVVSGPAALHWERGRLHAAALGAPRRILVEVRAATDGSRCLHCDAGILFFFFSATGASLWRGLHH